MANYYATIRTNYFSVKEESAFRKLMDSVCTEDEIYVFESPQSDGSTKFGFGCYGAINGIWVETDDEFYCDEGIDSFFGQLQQLVCADDAIIITEIGNEKLRYVVGFCTVITSKEIRSISISEAAICAAKELLRNQDFQTQMDY